MRTIVLSVVKRKGCFVANARLSDSRAFEVRAITMVFIDDVAKN
jgi:hypothetical protein